MAEQGKTKRRPTTNRLCRFDDALYQDMKECVELMGPACSSIQQFITLACHDKVEKVFKKHGIE